MQDFMLRTSSEQVMIDALVEAGLITEKVGEDGNPFVAPVSGVAYDPIGAIEGKDGRFHANVRVTFPLTDAQLALLPTFTPLPQVPYRVFA